MILPSSLIVTLILVLFTLKILASNDTVKKIFQGIQKDVGVNINDYHVYNIIFQENDFL